MLLLFWKTMRQKQKVSEFEMAYFELLTAILATRDALGTEF
jgi:hypothetical protein